MANLKAKVRGNPNKIIAQTLKIGNVALAVRVVTDGVIVVRVTIFVSVVHAVIIVVLVMLLLF